MSKDTTKRVFKYTLDNGLTVLVCPKKLAPKVSVQLWYNVGSKHEATGEKGMAHFIEHMIFKGTKELLSESDINLITQKLSGYANAFTSFDYTGYLFDVPVQNWEKVLPVLADCMSNCTFDQEHMNSEVKAVIQELKMYRDDFTWTLADGLITSIFDSHPYHHPIIGYKQDLWSLKRETLVNFYKKYYVPHNAALVLVGDIDPEAAYQSANLSFGSIPRGKDIELPLFYINEEVQAKTVSLYRPVEQSMCMLAFAVPGAIAKQDFVFDVIGYVLANGKASRLQKILVEEKELVSSVSAMTYDLFDKQVFFIDFKPKKESDIGQIKEIILQQIDEIIQNGLLDIELRRALKIAQVEYQHTLEDTQKQAYAIGKSFIATGDEEYPFTYSHCDKDQLRDDVIATLKKYFRATVCHQGSILNIPASDVPFLDELQKESDEMDTQILFGKERESAVAPGKYVETMSVNLLEKKPFAQPQEYQLENGLKVLLHHTDLVDTVELVLSYKASHVYDPVGYEGMGYLVSKMMLEGTTNLPHHEFAHAVESYGIGITTSPGQIEASMFKDDVEQGLGFVSDMIERSAFDVRDFDRLKSIVHSKLKHFWDTPKAFASQVAAEQVYKKHPYSYLTLGSEKTLAIVDRDYCFDYYKQILTPQGAILSIVGNFDQNTILTTIKKAFGSWTGKEIADLVYPALPAIKAESIDIKKNRDQVVLAFAGLSVSRLDPMYDHLLLYDQILSGGMSSRLFELREQSGLFYTIGGSLVHGAGRQPGMVFFKTIVSNDRLQEAERAIVNCFNTEIDTVTDQEFLEAQEVVVNTFPALYESNDTIASTFLFLQKYGLPFDYFERQIDHVRSITKETMQQSVKKILNTNALVTIKIGRL